MTQNEFIINWISMKDAENGEMLWSQEGNWNSTEIIEAHIPKRILQCRAVSREVNFFSRDKIESFKLVQNITLNGQTIEQWDFDFGFVIPGSTNTWEQIIDAAPPEEMLPAEVMSGNIIIETLFYDHEDVIKTTRVKIFYV